MTSFIMTTQLSISHKLAYFCYVNLVYNVVLPYFYSFEVILYPLLIIEQEDGA